MRKYENVDVTAALGAAMEINTEHYRSDFQYDRKMFMEAATAPDGDNNYLLWMSRPSGTECFRERGANITNTTAHNHWSYYAATRDTIHAYSVEITGLKNGRPVGNLYELDYRKHVQQLKRDALPPTEVTLFCTDGTQQRISHDEYKNSSNMNLTDKYGKIERVRFEVADEHGLQERLKQARADRKKYTPAVFKLRNSSRKSSIKNQLASGKALAAANAAVHGNQSVNRHHQEL